MTTQVEQRMSLARRLREYHAGIASGWIQRIRQLPDSHYAGCPVEDLGPVTSRVLTEIAQILDGGSEDALVEYLADVSQQCIEQGYNTRELIEALLLCKEAALPFICRQTAGDAKSSCESFQQLDACLRHVIGRLSAFYAEAGAALNSRLVKELRRRLAESESLQRVTSALLQKLTLPEVLEIVCTDAQRLTGAMGSTVDLLDDEVWLRHALSTGVAAPTVRRIPVDRSLTGMAVRTGQPFLTNDPAEQIGDDDGDGIPASLLAVPLRVRGQIIGALDVVNRPGGFTSDDVRIMSLFADQAAIAIENARLIAQEEQLLVLQERQRLARELHDSVTQSLYSVTLYTEAAARLLQAGRERPAVKHLREVREIAQEALAEMRLLIFELRPPLLEKEGLAVALQTRLETVEGRTGLQTELHVEGEQRLPVDVEEALYRIAREALNNTLKHARARRVSVWLKMSTPIHLQIADDGMGFDPWAAQSLGGLGLSGMLERARQIGATLTIDSAPGKGTRVIVDMIPAAESQGKGNVLNAR